MLKIRTPLFLLSCLTLLGGCSAARGVCPFPGATQVDECYYLLTITKKDSNGVRGQVSRAAVEENIAQLNFYVKGDDSTKYVYREYPIPMAPSDADKVNVGEDRWFVSVKGTDHLKPYTPPRETTDRYSKEKYPQIKPWDSVAAP
jgi:hypothetical protein